MKTFTMLAENITVYDDDEEVDLENLPSIDQVKQHFSELITVAQKVYDEWDEDVEEYAGGGICHLIADEICNVLQHNGYNCVTVSSSHEQHVYCVIQVKEGVYSIDIPYHYYETGGGFSWKKIQEVQFSPDDITLYRITSDPSEFEEITSDF